MAKINKLAEQLEILKKYTTSDSNYDVSSFEDENRIVVNINNDLVTNEDKKN